MIATIRYALRQRASGLLRSLGAVASPGTQLEVDETSRTAPPAAADGLASTVEERRKETTPLPPRPALVATGPMLQEAIDAIKPAAQTRGLAVYLVVRDRAPAGLHADPVWARQILTRLLTKTLDFAAPDALWLIAEAEETDAGVALRVTVRCFGVPLPNAANAALIHAVFGGPGVEQAPDLAAALGSRASIERAAGAPPVPTRLRCEGWSTVDGRTGNDFILILPKASLPGLRAEMPGESLGRGPPREAESEPPILCADRIRELQSNIPPGDLADMVEECIADLVRRLPALRRSLDAHAPGAVMAQTHAMVGLAGGYGMTLLEARLRAIRDAAQQCRMHSIAGAAAQIEADLERSAAALRQALHSDHPARSDART